ncbi:MAG: hypothetical protein NTZ33_06170 [Bacteroidetes bacterium]|nr:hypothetical protein [Bacteroidota bacterium]
MPKCKDCKNGCVAAISGKKSSWRCGLTRIPIYPNLPAGMRLATLDDIYPEAIRQIGLTYLLKSYYSGVFEAYTLSKNTDLLNLLKFIDNKRCWVKN